MQGTRILHHSGKGRTMKTRWVLLAFASLALAVVAYGFPTLTGPCGLVATPAATITPTGMVAVTADYYVTHSDTGGVKDSIPLQVIYGLSPNIEIGLGGWIGHVAGNDANTIEANAKYLLPWEPMGARLATGVIFANTNDSANPAFTEDAQTWELYLTGTHHCLPWLDSTLGVNFASLDAGAIHGSGFRGVVGAEAMLPYNWSLIGEFQTASGKAGDGQPLSSIAVRYPFTETLYGQVGFTNAGFATGGITASKEHNFFAGVTYGWGGTK